MKILDLANEKKKKKKKKGDEPSSWCLSGLFPWIVFGIIKVLYLFRKGVCPLSSCRCPWLIEIEVAGFICTVAWLERSQTVLESLNDYNLFPWFSLFSQLILFLWDWKNCRDPSKCHIPHFQENSPVLQMLSHQLPCGICFLFFYDSGGWPSSSLSSVYCSEVDWSDGHGRGHGSASPVIKS